ncbi:MAG: cytochrome c-type biogenesis protein CcmH [Alphaproteobacteria bacterium]|nr:MAG: cytochrome c-type biogenesis protein CcmH [Alphaproteobacteria bacterium]
MQRGFRIVGTLLLALVLAATLARAFEVDAPLKDPKLEARAEKIAKGIRCLVCQNESILDSNADLAKDLRQIVREHVAAGESDDEVRAFLVARYGDWVLLDPPFKLKTLLLWLGPLLIFILGLIAMILFLRRRAKGVVAGEANAAALSTEEEAELARLLHSPDEEDRA